jgi:hypothetical protein
MDDRPRFGMWVGKLTLSRRTENGTPAMTLSWQTAILPVSGKAAEAKSPRAPPRRPPRAVPPRKRLTKKLAAASDMPMVCR